MPSANDIVDAFAMILKYAVESFMLVAIFLLPIPSFLLTQEGYGIDIFTSLNVVCSLLRTFFVVVFLLSLILILLAVVRQRFLSI